MNFKKTLIKSLAFAFALGFIGFASPQTASASGGDAITFVGAEEKAAITGYKFWAVVKEVKDAKKADFTASDGKHYKADDVAQVVGGAIDLSFLNKKSKNIIAASKVESFNDPQNAWVVKEIEGQNKDFNAGFVNLVEEKARIGSVDVPKANAYVSPELGAFAVVNGSSVIDLAADSAKTVEVKSGKSGTWVSANVFFGGASADALPDEAAQKAVIKRLSQRGVNLAIRLKGTATAWPSKEVKVKISKQDKAPNVTVDTTKGIVNFKKGQEYKVTLEQADESPTYTEATGKMDFKKLNIDGSKGVVIKVRNKATAKKAPSKITTVTLKKQAGFKVEALTKSGDLVADALTLVTKLPYDISKGAHIENKTEKEYEYVITYVADAPAADAKWIKIKPCKKDKKKPAVIKPSKTTVKFSKEQKDNTYTINNENAKIYVRLAGTKQDKKDFSALLPSPVSKDIADTSGSNTFKLANDPGEFSKPTTAPIAITGLKEKTEKTQTVEVEFSKLFKDNSSPKLKITEKVNGVSVKVSKMKKQDNGKGTGTLTIKVSKSAFKTKPSSTPTLKFEMSLEGITYKGSVTFAFAN